MSSRQVSQLRAMSTIKKARLAHKSGLSRTRQRPRGYDIRDTLEKLVEKEVTTGLSRIFESNPERGSNGTIGSSGRSSSVQNRKAGFIDQRQMETTIDQMVAASLVGGRQTSGVLRALFGLVPSLIGR